MMSSMRSVAFLRIRFCCATVASAAVQQSSARRAAQCQPSSADQRNPQSRHQLCDRRLAPAAAEQRLCLRRLCALPDANPGWPGESDAAQERREGDAPGRERRSPSSPSSARDEPTSGNGWARLADAYRQPASPPRRSPRRARPGRRAISPATTSMLCSRASARSLTAADHDRRIDALLFDKKAERCPAPAAVGQPGPARGACGADRHANRARPTPRAL